MCQSLAQHGLWSFSCHMPVSALTAVLLQMGCRVEVALVLGKAGVACGARPGAGLGAVNAILTPCKNIEDMVSRGRATAQPATMPVTLLCPLLGTPFPSVQSCPPVQLLSLRGWRVLVARSCVRPLLPLLEALLDAFLACGPSKNRGFCLWHPGFPNCQRGFCVEEAAGMAWRRGGGERKSGNALRPQFLDLWPCFKEQSTVTE